jgi:hypothetical protein
MFLREQWFSFVSYSLPIAHEQGISISLYLFVCMTASNCLLQSYAVLDTPGIFKQSRTKYVDPVLRHSRVRMDPFYDRCTCQVTVSVLCIFTDALSLNPFASASYRMMMTWLQLMFQLPTKAGKLQPLLWRLLFLLGYKNTHSRGAAFLFGCRNNLYPRILRVGGRTTGDWETGKGLAGSGLGVMEVLSGIWFQRPRRIMKNVSQDNR